MDNTRLPKHTLNYKPRGRRIVADPGNDGNASMPEQVKRPNPWRKIIIIIIIISSSSSSSSTSSSSSSIIHARYIII